ncbi:MAG: hypothetical protein SGPRY_002688 [Prymnesium sp.]
MNVIIGAILAYVIVLALGITMQALADSELLRLFSTESSSGLEAHAREPNWSAVPLCLLDVALLWSCNTQWAEHSWWGGLRGPLRSQLRTLATCTFSILPGVLGLWLAWMPPHCSPLPCLLALLVASLSASSLLFWTSRLPLLPAADVTPACAKGCVRRGIIFFLHAVQFVGLVAFSAPAGECVAFVGMLAKPYTLAELLHKQMVEQTVQSMLSPATLVAQVLFAVLAIHIVIDEPTGLTLNTQDGAASSDFRGSRRLLWGDTD